jgi:hypothetical protein
MRRKSIAQLAGAQIWCGELAAPNIGPGIFRAALHLVDNQRASYQKKRSVRWTWGSA